MNIKYYKQRIYKSQHKKYWMNRSLRKIYKNNLIRIILSKKRVSKQHNCSNKRRKNMGIIQDITKEMAME